MNNSRLTHSQYVDGIISGDRVTLSKAITLVESNLAHDRLLAEQVIDTLIDRTGNSIRIGITGVPGVGKSTFIESFGQVVTSAGKKIAVLTVDPSSQLTQGSILGDKTRMQSLSKNKNAYIRPTASGSILGGVASKTREAMLLCEAAGFDVILIETVGVGQSEVAVKSMVDFFLLLMLAGAGDELQGIKKGIMEMADALVVTKADGANIAKAKEAQADYQHAMHLLPAKPSGWTAPVLTCSALENTGIDDIWKMICKFQSKAIDSGAFAAVRKQQNVQWFQEQFQQLLVSDLHKYPSLEKHIASLSEDVKAVTLSPNAAARLLLQAYYDEIRK